MEKPTVRLNSPLPWRISFDAEVTSYDCYVYDLRSEFNDVVWEAEVPDDAIDWGDDPDGDRRYDRRYVRVVLEPIR